MQFRLPTALVVLSALISFTAAQDTQCVLNYCQAYVSAASKCIQQYPSGSVEYTKCFCTSAVIKSIET